MQKPVASLADAVSAFGAAAKAKLSNPAATGAPEDQLKAPPAAALVTGHRYRRRYRHLLVVTPDAFGRMADRPSAILSAQPAVMARRIWETRPSSHHFTRHMRSEGGAATVRPAARTSRRG